MASFKFLILTIIVTITIIPLSIYGAKVVKKRSEFGENCNKTMKCSGSAWLICVGGVCSCAKPTEMMYDTNLKKCVSKAGERCRYEIDGSSSDMKIFEKSDCISNAICGSDGTCDCREEFYETSNGTCTRRGEFKNDCISDNECRSDMFLKCIDDSCQCDTTQSEFSFQHNHCVGLGGHPCSNGKCTDNALCQNNVCVCPPKNTNTNIEFFQHETGKCVPKKDRLDFCKSTNECKQTNIFLSCVDGRCDCDPGTASYESIYDSRRYESRYECAGLAGKKCNPNRSCVKNSECNGYGNCTCHGSYSATSTGRCGRNHGESCDSDYVCADAFTCRGQSCTCKTLLQSTYSSGKCRSLAYGPCQTDGDCIESADCIKSQPEASVGYCKCKKGFVENANDGCDIEYGLPCPKSGYSCDTLASLECLNRVCSCGDLSMLFDPKTRQCLGLVGFVCKKNPIPPGNAGALRCVENAIYHSAHEKLQGHCKCSDGFSETPQRTCTKIVPLDEQEPDLLILTPGGFTNISAAEPSGETIPGHMEANSMEETTSTESKPPCHAAPTFATTPATRSATSISTINMVTFSFLLSYLLLLRTILLT